MINIEMVRLSALEEHHVPCIQRVVEQSADVYDVGLIRSAWDSRCSVTWSGSMARRL